MKKLYVLVGCPGSGKSTWARKIFTCPSAKIVSRDDIRFSLVKPDEPYFSKEKQVFSKYIDEIKSGLENCDFTVADATHLNEASRNKLIRSLGKALEGVEVDAVVIDTDLNTALFHNEKRAGTRSYVPETALKRMFFQLTMPAIEEGFDKIYIYQPDNEVKYKIYTRKEV